MADQSMPVKGVAFDLYFSIFLTAGTIVADPAGMAARIVNATHTTGAACDNAPTAVDTTGGVCKLTLTAAEMASDYVIVTITATDVGAVSASFTIYPAAAYLPTVVSISALDTLLDAIKAKTDTISTGSYTAVGPVVSGEEVEIVQGDDYAAADSRELTITGSGWPTLTGNTVEIVVDGTAYACTVTDVDTFTCELTAAQTTAMTVGTQDFTIVCTIGTRHLTLGRGSWTVTAVPEEDA
ncbi:MAG TPA: hypothetical protein VFH61_08650 [Thermoleophilia bacterium]|nr:hypothetical protein [Thermoleophilia bacterium]